MATPSGGRLFRHCNDAAADVAGELLMVVVFVALAVTLADQFVAKPPSPDLEASLVFDIICRDGIWSDANDMVHLYHRGGQPIASERSRLMMRVDGIETLFKDQALTGPFADGTFAIGEVWKHAAPLGGSTRVDIELFYTHPDGSTEMKAVHQGNRRCETETAPPPSTMFDPGFAYEDIDGDCLYTPGVDHPLLPVQILDGIHTAAPGRGLVVPPSVGPISTNNNTGIELISGGGCLHLAVDYETTRHNINEIDSGGGPLTITDATIHASKKIEIRSGGGTMTFTDVTITSDSDKIDILTEGGDLASTGLTVTAPKKITVNVGGSTADMPGATIRSTGDDVIVIAHELNAFGSTFHAKKWLTITTTGNMDLQSSTLRSDTETIILDKTLDANTLWIHSADIFEPGHNNKADVRPSHTQGVVGTPDFGGLE